MSHANDLAVYSHSQEMRQKMSDNLEQQFKDNEISPHDQAYFFMMGLQTRLQRILSYERMPYTYEFVDRLENMASFIEAARKMMDVYYPFYLPK